MVDVAESERLVREAPYADSLPVISKLLVSPAGLLFAVLFSAPGDSVWQAVAIDSTLAPWGIVSGPATWNPIAFLEDGVLLSREREDGTLELEVRNLVPDSGPMSATPS